MLRGAQRPQLNRKGLGELARVAHDLWCASMRARGWTYGSRFDPKDRTHDALVPFDELSAQDQRHARLGIQAQELERALVVAIDYQRGPDREFTREEIRHGLPVALVDPDEPGGVAPFTGVIQDWTVDADGELDLIRVRWPDGRRSEYAAGERALARVSELAAG